MKKEKAKHSLAVLRVILGKSQKEMAELLSLSLPTIQSYEIRRLELKPSRAEEISLKTGISVKWLLDGDPKATPTDRAGEEYTRASFDRAKNANNPLYEPEYWASVLDCRSSMVDIYCLVASIIMESYKKGIMYPAAYRILSSIQDAAKDYPVDPKFKNEITKIMQENRHAFLNGNVQPATKFFDNAILMEFRNKIETAKKQNKDGKVDPHWRSDVAYSITDIEAVKKEIREHNEKRAAFEKTLNNQS